MISSSSPGRRYCTTLATQRGSIGGTSTDCSCDTEHGSFLFFYVLFWGEKDGKNHGKSSTIKVLETDLAIFLLHMAMFPQFNSDEPKLAGPPSGTIIQPRADEAPSCF